MKENRGAGKYRWLALGTGIGILALLVYFAGFERFIGVIRRASPGLMAAAVLVLFGGSL